MPEPESEYLRRKRGGKRAHQREVIRDGLHLGLLVHRGSGTLGQRTDLLDCKVLSLYT